MFKSTVISIISPTESDTTTSIVSKILSISSCVISGLGGGGVNGSSSISTITISVSSVILGKSTVISVISDSTSMVTSGSGSLQSPALLLLSLLLLLSCP